MDNRLMGFYAPSSGFAGYKLIASDIMRDAIWGKRSFFERWFTFPWKPRQKMKITGYKPWSKVIIMDGKIIAAPEIIEQLKLRQMPAEQLSFGGGGIRKNDPSLTSSVAESIRNFNPK
jgi:hypothetical protein